VKKTAKTYFSLLGTVDDGVKKDFFTASGAKWIFWSILKM
jgi:hypothetical protein